MFVTCLARRLNLKSALIITDRFRGFQPDCAGINEDLACEVARLTAEAPEPEERARLLAAVTVNGFIDDYAGIRISKSGRRFRIRQATVWNLIRQDGVPCGQAATFRGWRFFPV